MAVYVDDLQRAVAGPHMAACIVSLVPSLTELLWYLECDLSVKGITKFCVHPQEWQLSKFIIGGTKTVSIEKIKSLHPELVIAAKEENIREQIEEIATFAPVYVTDIKNYNDALQIISRLGTMLGKLAEAKTLLTKIDDLHNCYTPPESKIKCAYFIWHQPCMVAGGDTYINSMLSLAGFENVFATQSRYPTVTAEDITDSGAEVLLLSSEPFPFKASHVKNYHARYSIPAMVVDGEMFSWYGSRMLQAFPYFHRLMEEVKKIKWH